MTKKALIHIGAPKTGSTTIQIALTVAGANARLGSVAYPDFTSDVFSNAHHYLSLFYQDEAAQFPHFRHQAKHGGYSIPEMYETFQNILASNEKVILSAESMMEFDRDSIRRLKQDLDRHGYTEYMIVLYVREPVAHYRSILQEFLKISRYCIQPYYYRGLVRMKNAAQAFADVFGDCMCVREFERDKLVGNDVVADFASVASRFFDEALTPEPIAVNESLSAEAAFIMHRYRCRPEFSGADERIYTPEAIDLIAQLNATSRHGSKIALHPDVAAFISARNANAAAWFRDEYGIDFTSVEAQTQTSLEPVLRLEEIIVKPDERSIANIRNMVNPPPPNPLPINDDEESRLRRFVADNRHRHKVLYGGGSGFFTLIAKIWQIGLELDYTGIRFVDGKPGERRIRDLVFEFESPEAIDWLAVDEVLICTPDYDTEIRQYLLGKNERLKLTSISNAAKRSNDGGLS